MSSVYTQDGNLLNVVAAGTVAVDSVVVTGDIIGIASIAAVAGETYPIIVEGVVKVPKVAGEAWVVGDKIGYDVSALAFDKTFVAAAGDVTDCGVAALAAASADTVGYLKLTPGAGTGQ